MNESLNSHPEQDQPPVLSELEAQAALAAKEAIEAARFDGAGNQVSQEGVLGVTSDGLLVSVEHVASPAEQTEGPNYTYAVKTGRLAELTAGGTLAEEVPSKVLKFMSTGPSLTTSVGKISYDKPAEYRTTEEDLPTLRLPTEEKVVRKIYPIGSDGQPYVPKPQAPEAPVPTTEPEQAVTSPHESHPAQVSIGGLRGLFKRRR